MVNLARQLFLTWGGERLKKLTSRTVLSNMALSYKGNRPFSSRWDRYGEEKAPCRYRTLGFPVALRPVQPQSPFHNPSSLAWGRCEDLLPRSKHLNPQSTEPSNLQVNYYPIYSPNFHFFQHPQCTLRRIFAIQTIRYQMLE